MTVEPLYGGGNRVSNVAELKYYIVHKMIRIIGPGCIQVSQYASMLYTIPFLDAMRLKQRRRICLMHLLEYA